MPKYEPCINETKKVTFLHEEAGVVSRVATTQELNRICIGMLKQSMFQLEGLIVLSADSTVQVWTPSETTNIGTTEMGSDCPKISAFRNFFHFQQYGRRCWADWPSWEMGTTSVLCVVTPPTGKTTPPGTYWPSTLDELCFISTLMSECVEWK